MIRTAIGAAALLAAAGVAGQEAKRPEPVGDPASWVTPNDYPPPAIRVRAEGRVVAALTVDATGKVTSCKVEQSAGNAALDAAACAVLTTRAKFKPALDAQGRPVASTYSLPIRWSLPSGPQPIEVTAPGASLDTDLAVELELDGEGKVLACRVLATKLPTAGPKPEAIDACAPFKPGQQGGPPLRRNGRPVPSKVVQRLSRQVTVAR